MSVKDFFFKRGVQDATNGTTANPSTWTTQEREAYLGGQAHAKRQNG